MLEPHLRRLQIAQGLRERETTESDHVGEIVRAIEGIQLAVDHPETVDLSPAIESLGEAFTKAIKAHGNALMAAFSKIEVNPQVSVPVTVEPKFEIETAVNVPEMGEVTYQIHRDKNGLLESVTVKPTTEKPVSRVELE